MLHPADDGQQARNSCTGLQIFFSGVTHSFCSCITHIEKDLLDAVPTLLAASAVWL